MSDRYEPQNFEAKWRKRWKDADLFLTREDPDRPKFYCLDMFPYPSGAGLSVGHCRNYIPGDVLARMKFMQGHNVLHPMGFDAFGLPAEVEAIKKGVHPDPMVASYAENYRRQLDLVGIGYDWSRSFRSSDPSYYKWTQWIFSLLFKRGLAYRRLASVNWCDFDKTVLADEEVVGGLCWRCSNPVGKKWIPQWFFKITDYAQRLLDDLDTIDWPEGIKAQQRNWIGRSEGVQFSIRVEIGPGTPSPFSGWIVPANGEGAEIGPGTPSPFSGWIVPANGEGAGGGEKQLERELRFEVFTTRIDTIFGMSFCVLAPEHPLVDTLCKLDEGRGGSQAALVRSYLEAAAKVSDTDRQADTREKTGVYTGFNAINPANGKRVPIWVADYVLMNYGTGAIMAVPAGDQRDLEFAIKFDIPVIPIQNPTADFFSGPPRPDERRGEGAGGEGTTYEEQLASYLEDPRRFPTAFTDKNEPLINAGEYTGMNFEQATKALGEWMEALGIGQRKIQYKLRDWLISRQRYWGCPIPIIHTKDGGMEAVPDECLPVLLPDVDSYEPSSDGTSPLAKIPEYVNVTDSDGSLGQRETDTMGGFACSSWYFLRFCDPHNDEQAWSKERADAWMPVDCYVGGAEHAVMHLLYARFWTKVLFDAGLVSQSEPFSRLQNQGQVLARTPYRKPREGESLQMGEQGIQISFAEAAALPADEVAWRWARMSKSKGNVVTPDEVVEKEGADALRVYELFVAPFEADVQWSSEGLQGAVRFLGKVFRLVEDARSFYDPNWQSAIGGDSLEIRRLTHQTILKVTEDIDRFAFNTYISALMIFVNELSDQIRKNGASQMRLAISEAIETLIILLSPAAPHSADELWESLGKEGFTYLAPWPIADETLTREDTVTIAIQVNGKLRDTMEMSAGASKVEIETSALQREKIKAHLNGAQVRKIIVIPDRLVNIVVA